MLLGGNSSLLDGEMCPCQLGKCFPVNWGNISLLDGKQFALRGRDVYTKREIVVPV